jgi:HAE1 family hydrophobic/amphiphilic exporter-1
LVCSPIALATGAGAEWKNGLGDHWWVNKSLFLTLIVVPVIYEIMEKLIHKLTKGKTDYEALMVADYEHKTLSED